MVQHIYCILLLRWADFAVSCASQFVCGSCWRSWQNDCKVSALVFDIVRLEQAKPQRFYAYHSTPCWVAQAQWAIARICALFSQQLISQKSALWSYPLERFFQTSWERFDAADGVPSAVFFVRFFLEECVSNRALSCCAVEINSWVGRRMSSTVPEGVGLVRVVA